MSARASCHACGDTVEVSDGAYYDHGACSASGKPVPASVEVLPRTSIVGHLALAEPCASETRTDCLTIDDGTDEAVRVAVDDGEAVRFVGFVGRRVRITIEVLPGDAPATDAPEAT